MEEKDFTHKKNKLENKDGHTIIKLLITRVLLLIFGIALCIISVYRIFNQESTINEYIVISIVLISILLTIKFIDKKIRAIPAKSEIIAEFFLGKGISISKYDIINKEVKAGDDIFLKGVGTTSPYNPAILNVHIELEKIPSVLTLNIFKTLNSKIVSEQSKEIKSINIHDLGILVNPGELVNMKVDKSAIFKKLIVTETYLT